MICCSTASQTGATEHVASGRCSRGVGYLETPGGGKPTYRTATEAKTVSRNDSVKTKELNLQRGSN